MNRLCYGIGVLVLFCATAVTADDSTGLAEQLKTASQNVTAQKYDLRFKFKEGETLRWKVVHRATTQTKIRGNTQNSQSRSISTKAWKITEVDDDGNVTFVHTVEDVDMWQKISDREEIHYNSKSGKKPPLIYEGVADTVGVPLATVTIDPHGQVIDRNSKLPTTKTGLGQITMPLPPEPVQIGAKWFLPGEVTIRLEDKRIKQIKIRKKYALASVKDNVAQISVETQVLSVISDPSEKAQLVQQLTQGTVVFDIEKGHVVSKQMDWDETVIGFNGAESIMQYVARFNEDLIPAEARSAAKPKDDRGGEPKVRE